jgi:hypothetical protein
VAVRYSGEVERSSSYAKGSSALMTSQGSGAESPSLVLVINDTKLLMPCVKCFQLGISNTCDEGVCGKECGHKITKKWCMDMMIKWRRRI